MGCCCAAAFLRPEGSAGALDLEGCGFEALPREVWQLPGRVGGLMELNLNNNRLRDLPEVGMKLSGHVGDGASRTTDKGLLEQCYGSWAEECTVKCSTIRCEGVNIP